MSQQIGPVRPTESATTTGARRGGISAYIRPVRSSLALRLCGFRGARAHGNTRQYGCGMAAVRFLTWNMNNFTRGRRADKARLLDEIPWNVAALQECDLASFELVCGSAHVDAGVHALQLVPSSVKANHNGCALLVRGGAIEDPRTWPSAAYDPDHRDQPFPERCLAAHLVLSSGKLTAVSFHAPHAASSTEEERLWRVARKNGAYRELVEGLNLSAGPVALGMDGNMWTDPVDLHAPEPDLEQPDVVGFHLAGPPHRLKDAYRIWLEDHEDTLDRLRRLRPDGQLAVTYDRGKKGRPEVNRMDRVYVSDDFVVRTVEHGYGEALAAGSDHAYVFADMEIS